MGASLGSKRLRLLHPKPAEAAPRAESLRRAGFHVAADAVGPDFLKRLTAQPPDAVVIDLSRVPSMGRDAALAIRERRSTRSLPLAFLGGDPEKVAAVRALLPDAGYGSWDNARSVIRSAIANAPAEPTVPGTRMAAYAGVALPVKLGIEPGTTLALVGAPRGFLDVLGRLPRGVRVSQRAGRKSDVILWFVKRRVDLERRVVRMRERVGKGGLWIIWPKRSSGVESDLTQAVVRAVGMGNGLVDYKIGSIDATWSGLRFARRGEKRRGK
jgi:hypothetical protein